MNKDSLRLVLFLALSGAILFGYQFIFMPKDAAKPAAGQAVQAPEKETPPIAAAKPAPEVKKETPKQIKPVKETLYVLENSMVSMRVTTAGASLSSVKIKKYSDKGEHTELITSPASYTYLSLTSPYEDLVNVNWSYGGERDAEDGKTIVFSRTLKDGLKITKEMTLVKDSYLIKTRLIFTNTSSDAVAVKDMGVTWGPNIHFTPMETMNSKNTFAKFQRYAYMENTDLKKKDINFRTKTDVTTVLQKKPLWIAYKDFYFLGSFIFDSPSDYKSMYAKELVGGFAFIGVNFNDIALAPKTSQEIMYSSFIGPQEYKLLKKTSPNMDHLVEMGWPRFLGVWMFYATDFFHKITKNYGLAIILITILIRAVLWFPSQNSFKHMKDTQKKMTVIKPRLETLKKVYANDSQKLNEEMMKLYQEYKINPFGGCLPMLLQLPIFIALYNMLINMVELKGAYFGLWLTDLSMPDKFYVMPLLMGLSMFIQQKMSTTMPAADEQAAMQQKIFLWGMPIMLTFMSLQWPSGLLLYWTVSNILGIAQQYLVNKTAK